MATSEKLIQAISLVKSGKKEEARALLLEVVWDEPQNESAWFWLVETMPDNSQRIRALEECLRHNPESQRAKTGLEAFRNRQAVSSLSEPVENLPASKRKAGWQLVALAMGVILLIALGGFFLILSRPPAAQQLTQFSEPQSGTTTTQPPDTGTTTSTPEATPTLLLEEMRLSAPEVSDYSLSTSYLPLGLIWEEDNIHWSLNEVQPPDGFEEYESNERQDGCASLYAGIR
jgi:hypothetical protein